MLVWRRMSRHYSSAELYYTQSVLGNCGMHILENGFWSIEGSRAQSGLGKFCCWFSVLYTIFETSTCCFLCSFIYFLCKAIKAHIFESLRKVEIYWRDLVLCWVHHSVYDRLINLSTGLEAYLHSSLLITKYFSSTGYYSVHLLFISHYYTDICIQNMHNK